jgi:hypothetical protein
MTETELADIALSEWPLDVRDRILDDLRLSDGSFSVYGWHEFIPVELCYLWERLDMSQKIIAYIAASRLGSHVG